MKDFVPPEALKCTSPPRVSVLMPVFNTANYLHGALESISGQTFKDFELIVLDDGSTDGSTELLELIAQKEPRIRLIMRGNRGLIATRNELLGAARAELIAWMDSDDISLPDRLAIQLEAFTADPTLACLGSAAQCIDPEGEYLNIEKYPLGHEEILAQQQKGGAMRFPTTMMRRDLARQVGGFREPFRIGEDFDLLLRLSEVGKMANLPDTLYLYRQRISSVCATLGPQWIKYRDHILELARERRLTGRDLLQNGGSLTIETPPITVDRKRLESLIYINWARCALMNKNILLAWKYAYAGVLNQPLSIGAWKTVIRVCISLRPAPLVKSIARRSRAIFASRI